MKKYKVYGTVTVSVVKEVWANNEDEAYEKASKQLPILGTYCGNGGCDKLVGVEEDGEFVGIYDDIEYDDIEMIENDHDYFECLDCFEECERKTANDGVEYWHCNNCGSTYDDDGDEFYIEEEDYDE